MKLFFKAIYISFIHVISVTMATITIIAITLVYDINITAFIKQTNDIANL